MKVRIYTTDTTWIERNALSVEQINGNTAATIAVTGPVERLTFAGKSFVRFNMGADVPADWANGNAMVPATHVVSV